MWGHGFTTIVQDLIGYQSWIDAWGTREDRLPEIATPQTIKNAGKEADQSSVSLGSDAYICHGEGPFWYTVLSPRAGRSLDVLG